MMSVCSGATLHRELVHGLRMLLLAGLLCNWCYNSI